MPPGKRTSGGPQRPPVPALGVGDRQYFADAWYKEKWGDDEWLPLTYAEPVKATMQTIHASSSATLRFRFGRMAQELQAALDKVTPPRVPGWYIAIRTVRDNGVSAPQLAFVGFATAETLLMAGRRTDPDNPTRKIVLGDATFTVPGLEYILDRRQLTRTPVLASVDDEGDQDESTLQELTEVVPFNQPRLDGLPDIGNRSLYKFNPTGPPSLPRVYGFADRAAARHTWSHRDVIDGLFHWTEPRSPDDNYVVNYEPHFDLDGPPEILAFLGSTASVVKAQGRSVLNVIRKLINRHRGIAAYLAYDIDDTSGLPLSGADASVHVRLFSMLDLPLVIDPVTIPANPNTVTFEPGDDESIEMLELTRDESQRFERVEVKGEPMHVTFSAAGTAHDEPTGPDFHPPSIAVNFARLHEAWSLADENTYGNADEAVRRTEALEHVWALYKLSAGQGDPDDPTTLFDWLSTDQTNDPRVIHNLHPRVDENGEVDFSANGVTADPQIRFAKFLPIALTADTKGEVTNPRFRKPFALVSLQRKDDDEEYDDTPSRFVFVDVSDPPKPGELYENQAADEYRDRGDVAADMHLHDGEGFIEIRFRQAAHILGRTHFNGKSNVAPVFDHMALIVTVNVITYHRPTVVREFLPRSHGTIGRVLTIDVPGAHLWVMAGNPVIGLNTEGNIVRSPNRAVRDDTELLRKTADLAASWYSIDRYTLKVRRRGLGSPEPLGSMMVVQLGELDRSPAYTAVTGNVWNFDDNTVGFSTDALDIDVRPFA